MKRSGFKRPAFVSLARVRQWEGPMPTPRAPALRVVDTRSRMVVPIAKHRYVRSKKLREAYRLIPCQFDELGALCAVADGTVCCCHANWSIFGKGGSIKADDSRAASGCARHHEMLDQGSEWTTEERQARWWRAHVRTVALLVGMGAWPKAVAVPDTASNPFEGTSDLFGIWPERFWQRGAAARWDDRARAIHRRAASRCRASAGPTPVD